MLTILSEKKRRLFYEQHLNQVRPVLFEAHPEPGKMSGFTDNYIKIETKLQQELLNTILPVQLRNINRNEHVEIETEPHGLYA